MDKKTIVWDVDDVLNILMEEYVLFLKSTYNIKHIDLHTNPPLIVGMNKDEYLSSLDEFRLKYYDKLIIEATVFDWFKKYGNNFHHIALTTTPRKTADLSAKWIMRYFGDWIQSINFIFSKREDDSNVEYFKSKGEWIRWFGKVDYFIDDNEKNINEAKILNPDLICGCPKQPWNNGISLKEILDNLNKGI